MAESPRVRDSSNFDEERIRLQPFGDPNDSHKMAPSSPPYYDVQNDCHSSVPKPNGNAPCQHDSSRTPSEYEPRHSVECGAECEHDCDSTGSESRRYTRSPLRLLCAFMFLALSAFMNFFLLVIVHDVVPPYGALPDLVFMLIPQQHWAWFAGDVLSLLACVSVVTMLVFHKYRWIALRRAFIIFGIMFGLRSFCLGTTFLPPSFHHRAEICLEQNNITQTNLIDVGRRFVNYMLTMGLTSGQPKILCGDLMFSGHTTVFTLMYCFALHYSPPRAWWFRWAMIPVCFVGMVFVVISGGHYTIDVLIAYWLGTNIFWAYHHIFEQPHASRDGTPLTNVWWYYVCYWLESDVPDGRLPNELDWPLPWPQRLITATDWCSQRLQYQQHKP